MLWFCWVGIWMYLFYVVGFVWVLFGVVVVGGFGV